MLGSQAHDAKCEDQALPDAACRSWL
jgi:hypothetical protein